MKNKEAEKNLITVVAVEPGKKPYIQKIPNTLEALQHEVGGYIEVISPYADPVAIIINEEGKIKKLPFNRAVWSGDRSRIYDYLLGKFLIVGVDGEEFSSIPEKLVKKYIREFYMPEQLMQVGNTFYVVSVPDGNGSKK